MATQRNKLAPAHEAQPTENNDLLKVVKRKFFAKPLPTKIRFAPGFRDISWNEIQEISKSRVSAKKSEEQPTLKDLEKDTEVLDLELELAWEIALRSKTISDMFLLIGKKRVQTTSDLEKFISGLDIQNFLPAAFQMQVSAESTASKIFHEGGIEETVVRELKRLKFPDDSQKGQKKTVRFLVEIHRDVCRVWLGISAEPLWKKGYKAVHDHAAPLREDLAACAVRTALNTKKKMETEFTDLVVPFAGSGTLGFESERFLERGIGEQHALAVSEKVRESFFVPKGFEARFANLVKRISLRDPKAKTASLNFQFCEINKDAKDVLTKNLVAFFRERPTAKFSISSDDCFQWKPKGNKIFVPLNPPYGERLKGKGINFLDLGKWVVDLQKTTKGDVHGFCLCGDETQSKAFIDGLKSSKNEWKSKVFHFTQGGLHIRMVSF
jgi:23S rRNA G2445 N2-methylase RlmL